MKSLPRLFAAVLLPILALSVLAGCSGPPHNTTKTLTSIAVTPASPAHLKVGATQQFTATGTFSDGSTSDITATVTWTSGTTATATISTSGLATGVAQGTTSITAAMSGVTSPGVTLTVIALTSIAITPNPASVAVGATVQFTATGTYSDASTADITTLVAWSSAPTSTATIGASTGLATGVANGTAQIFAQLGSIAAPSVTLTVGTGGTPVAIAVKIVQANPTIAVGNVEDFAAKFLLSDGTLVDPTAAVTWTSGTTATATIISSTNNIGIASGLAAGTSTITAASTGLTSGTTVLTVAAAVPRFVYTIGPQDGVTSGFAINSSAGALAPLPALADTGSTPGQLIFEPSGQFVYAPGAQGFIDIFAVDLVSGKLGSSGLASVAITSTGVGITQSAVDPTGRYLYVLDGGAGLVNSYSIDTTNTPTKGNLSATSTPTVATGSGAQGIVVDPPGRFVYVTNNGDNTISGYSIGADGSLTALASIGAGPFTSLNGPFFPAIDSAGQFLFVPNNGGSSVSSFTIAADGSLTFVNAATSVNGALAAAVDPAGKFLFVTDFGDGTIASIPIGSGGTLGTATTTNTGLFGAATFPWGVTIDRSGILLSVVNNGENSLALFGVANGVLTPKFLSETREIPQFASFYSGTSSPVIGPSNVFAANSGSGNISGFSAANTTGILTAGTGSPTTGVAGNTFLTADYSGTFLYTSSPTATKQLAAFGVDPATAGLAGLTGSPFNLSTSTDAPSEIAAEPSSRFFYVADTTGAAVEGFTDVSSISSIGLATPALTSVNTVVGDPQGTLLYALGTNVINPIFVSGFVGTLASSPDALAQTGTWTSGAIDPSGHWLVALDSVGKTIQSFGITPIQVFGTPDGKLTVGPSLATGLTAPSSMTFDPQRRDPQGRFVFVSDATNGTVTTFAFNDSTGAITATGKQTTVDATGTGKVSIDASGTFLYAAVKGNGTTVASGVAAYKINSDGSLTAVAGSPFATGAGTSGTSGVAVTTSVQ